MKILVKIKPGAKSERIEKIDNDNFKVSVKERPEKGRANEAIVLALAKYFKVVKSRIKIVSGYKSRRKIIEIL